jgi:NhaP-type Na+/H+ or K+/H+ antiporter
MSEDLLVGLASIIVLGIGAQWLAWRLHLPSILLLLIFGFIAGPVTGFLDPDAIFGDLLLPVVSLSVAIILLEGGLNLRISELRRVGGVVGNLITIGALVTWFIGSAAAYFILDLDFALSVLLAAILVVTGPTVILPLLRHLRPSGAVGPILKWEGITIDPIGAILAVLVFGAIIAGEPQEATALVIGNLLLTIVIGGVIGALGAVIVVLLLRSYLIPDFLHSPITLTMAIGAFVASNLLQADSGLLAVTLMGIILANQKTVSVQHIIEFKENLRVLLISFLFILLAASLDMDSFNLVGWNSLWFLAVLMLVARPLAVFLSTLRSGLSWRERLFLAWLAPRGIVAAAVASIFALRLMDSGHAQAELLVPVTFIVIAGTVAIYGLSASPLARWLKVAQPNPQGVMIIGAHSWARAIATSLKAEGYKVLLVDASWANISAARLDGLPTFYASVLSQYTMDEIDLGGMGRLLALTPDNEFNSLAVLQYAGIFGRGEVYQLASEADDSASQKAVSGHLKGRLLFSPDMTYKQMARRFAADGAIKVTALTKEFEWDAFIERYGGTAVPLFVADPGGKLTVFTAENPPKPRAGQKLISLISPVAEAEAAAVKESS